MANWMKRIFADIIKKLIVTAIATAITSGFLYGTNLLLPADFWQRKVSVIVNLSYLNIVAICGLSAVAFAGLVTLAILKLKKYRIFRGREAAMAANCELIKKFATDKGVEIRSTRVTHWRVADSSEGRQTFRNLLTQKITNSLPVKRLWELKDLNYFDQLRLYLKQYESYDNYYVKVIVAPHVWIFQKSWLLVKRLRLYPCQSRLRQENLGGHCTFTGVRRLIL